MDSSKPDLIVGNTRPKNSSHSNWHGCYCAYSFVIVMEDKNATEYKETKNIYIYKRKITGLLKMTKKKEDSKCLVIF